MITVDDYKDFKTKLSSHSHLSQKRSVVVVGNFDGFHRGHLSLWEHAVVVADSSDTYLLVALTFNPHPRVTFGVLSAEDLYFDENQKSRSLVDLGADVHVQQRFDQGFAQMSGQGFMKDVLVDGLCARHVVVGDDFCFAKDRSWDSHKMKRALQDYDVECHILRAQKTQDGQVISSSLMRRLARMGDVKSLTEGLGRYPLLEGPCVAGRGIGREALYPTANVDLGRKSVIKSAVYAAYVSMHHESHASLVRNLDSADVCHGVVNLGYAPTTHHGSERENSYPTLEVHLLDLRDPFLSLEGQILSVWLVDFIRAERVFDSLAELKDQITDDITQAKRILETEDQQVHSSSHP